MESLDKMIVKEMKEDIEDSVFDDECGQFIDSLADLETDEDIVNTYCLGGKEEDE